MCIITRTPLCLHDGQGLLFLNFYAYLLDHQGNKAVLVIPRMMIVSANELLAIVFAKSIKRPVKPYDALANLVLKKSLH